MDIRSLININLSKVKPMFKELIRGEPLKTLSSLKRNRYGSFGGLVGIAVNTVIFIIEVFAGLITGSIAIAADAVHNLIDVISSVITIISFKLAKKPADRKHPFGHGRVEYLSALIVAFIVMLIGYQFLSSSILKIMNPTQIRFSMVPFILVLVAIPLKLLLSFFDRRLARLIDSSTLKAASVDALSDVLILSVASVSLIVASVSDISVDGLLGVVVALFIMYSGFSIAKSALDPLLGQPPDPELVKNIVKDLCNYPDITGVHDLVIHNYGPGNIMASIHAEVPCDLPVMQIHETIDRAERELSERYSIMLVIHMDPLNKDDDEVIAAKEALMQAIRPNKEITSVHDFRIVGEGERKNLIFDAVVNSDDIRTERDKNELIKKVNDALQEFYPYYNTIMSIDRDYTQPDQ